MIFVDKHSIRSGNAGLNFDTNPIIKGIVNSLHTHPGKMFSIDDFDVDGTKQTKTHYVNFIVKYYKDIYRVCKGHTSVGIVYLPDTTKADSSSILSTLYELEEHTENMSKAIHDAIQTELGMG